MTVIELDIEGEDISVQFGVLKDMIIERIEQLKNELGEPMKRDTQLITRLYIRELINQIRHFDNLFLRYNKGYRFPKSLTDTLKGILEIREMLIAELEKEANRTLIMKKRILEDLLPRLTEELLNYFKLVGSILYLRDRNLVAEDTVFVEEGEKVFEDEELPDKIREFLEMTEGDDALEKNAKETLLNLLDEDEEKFIQLLRIDPDDGALVRELEIDNETIRDLKRLGIIETKGRGKSRKVYLRPPYRHLIPLLIEASNNSYVEEV